MGVGVQAPYGAYQAATSSMVAVLQPVRKVAGQSWVIRPTVAPAVRLIQERLLLCLINNLLGHQSASHCGIISGGRCSADSMHTFGCEAGLEQASLFDRYMRMKGRNIKFQRFGGNNVKALDGKLTLMRLTDMRKANYLLCFVHDWSCSPTLSENKAQRSLPACVGFSATHN